MCQVNVVKNQLMVDLTKEKGTYRREGYLQENKRNKKVKLSMKVQFILYLLVIGDKRRRTKDRDSNDLSLAQSSSSDSN